VAALADHISVLAQQEDPAEVAAEMLQEELLNNLAQHQEVLAMQADLEQPAGLKLQTIRHTVVVAPAELAESEVKVLAAPVVLDIKILSQEYQLIMPAAEVAIYSIVMHLAALAVLAEVATVVLHTMYLIQLLEQAWTVSMV
jgi:hypothetical protein